MEPRIDPPGARHLRVSPVLTGGCLLVAGLGVYCAGYVGAREAHMLVHHDGMITGASHQVRPALGGAARVWLCESPAPNCWVLDVALPSFYAPLISLEDLGWELSSY